MNETKEVFREHLKECLEHLGKWFRSKVPPGSRDSLDAMKPMIDFFGAHQQTIRRWIDHGELPIGESRIKMMCYLDLHGYRVIEFERLPKAIRGFAELIGFDILDWREAARLIGYTGGHHIFAILWQKESASKKKEELMWGIWKERRNELEARKKEVWVKYRLKVLFESAPAQQPIQLALSAPTQNGKCGQNQLAVLSILESSLNLIEGCLFENLSEQELVKFAQPILRLSSRLSGLSSKILAIKGGLNG